LRAVYPRITPLDIAEVDIVSLSKGEVFREEKRKCGARGKE
jgi:hypothetical protein